MPLSSNDWLTELNFFFSAHLTTYITDQFDTMLVEGVLGQFHQLAESWDILPLRNDVLADIIGTADIEKFSRWLEFMRSRFYALQEENKSDPQSLRQLHIQFAQEIGRVIRIQFPNYSSGKYHLANITEANSANCVGYSTMFYLIAKQIGLNVSYTSPEYSGETEIHHAANFLHLPRVDGKDSIAIVDVTWSNYVSEPIEEETITVEYKDNVLRRVSIPKEVSRHNVVVEYNDPLVGIRHSLHSWSNSSNEYLMQFDLQKRAEERMLRMHPNDANALHFLGSYYAEAETGTNNSRDAGRAISYLERSLKIKMNYFALSTLKELFVKQGLLDEFYLFGEELIRIHNRPQTYITVTRVIEYDSPRDHEQEAIKKSISILEAGLTLFPNNADILQGLAHRYSTLFKNYKDESAYATAVSYMEKELTVLPSSQTRFIYRDLIRTKDPTAMRFIAFFKELAIKDPKLAGPITALMHHYELQRTEDGYTKAISLAKEYLERPESTNRESVFWNLGEIYTNSYYKYDRKNNIFYGKVDELLEYLQELSAKFPDSFDTVRFIGETFIEAKRFKDAIPYLQKFLKRIPRDKETLEMLILSYAMLQDWGSVLKTANIIFDVEVDNGAALKWQGTAYQELGRFSEAITVFERFLALGIGFHSAFEEVNFEEIKERLSICQKMIGVSETSKANVIKSKQKPDPSMTTTKGGIDLNPTILSTEIKRNGRGVIIPVFKGAVPDLNGMEGFVPNIINVTPITNLQFLLGLDTKSNENPQNPENEKPVDVSYNLSALPAKEREELNFELVRH